MLYLDIHQNIIKLDLLHALFIEKGLTGQRNNLKDIV